MQEYPREHTCCIMGPQPENIQAEEKDIRKWITRKIMHSCNDSYRVFLVDMDRGIGLWAAEEILRFREEWQEDIALVCVVPYRYIEQDWTEKEQRKFRELLSQADQVRYLSPRKRKTSLQDCGRWLVDHSRRAVPFRDGKHVPTEEMIRYAEENRIFVDDTDITDLELMRHNGYRCPCCGNYTLWERRYNYEICPVCFWEDDVVPVAGGANGISLREAQENYRKMRAMDAAFLDAVRKPTPEELP